jgi:hypothetical protein
MPFGARGLVNPELPVIRYYVELYKQTLDWWAKLRQIVDVKDRTT